MSSTSEKDEEGVMNHNKNSMTPHITLYLIGFAGTGKYTIAKELAKAGYKIIDNHLINNPIFSLLDLDGITPIPAKAWSAISKIREAVFSFIAQHPAANYVFTNVLLEDEDDHAFYDRMRREAEGRGAIFIPIRLLIAPHEHEKRVKSAERKEKFKTTVLSPQEQEKGLIRIHHPHLQELDVTHLSSSQATSAILEFVSNINNTTVNLQQEGITIRPATRADIPAMVALSDQKRRSYEKLQPQFWRCAEKANDNQAQWFEFLMSKGIGLFFIAEREDKVVGFIRGQLENAPEVYDPGGATLMIDDFCVENPSLWPTMGKLLLNELKTQAKPGGALQVVVVSGHHDEPKRQFLKNEGLSIASEWYVAEIE